MSNVSYSDLKFIKPSEVKLWIDNKANFAIVDVRDNDFVGGHIVGCLHYPANEFGSLLPDLLLRLKESKVKDVVFHCALSQARGPKSALLFMRVLAEDPDSDKPAPNVYVMEGGFTAWARKYGENPYLTEGFAEDIWNE